MPSVSNIIPHTSYTVRTIQFPLQLHYEIPHERLHFPGGNTSISYVCHHPDRSNYALPSLARHGRARQSAPATVTPYPNTAMYTYKSQNSPRLPCSDPLRSKAILRRIVTGLSTGETYWGRESSPDHDIEKSQAPPHHSNSACSFRRMRHSERYFAA